MKYTKIAMSLLLALLMSAMVLWPSWASELDDKQQLLDQINQQMEQERARLAQKENQKQSVTQQLNQLDQEIDLTQTDLKNINGNLILLQTRISVSQQDLQKAQADLVDRTQILNQRLRDIYTEGNVSYLDVLLNATSLNDFLTRFDLMQRIAEQDITTMKQITALRDRITQQKKDLETEKAQLIVLQGQASTKQVYLAARSDEKKQALSQIETQRDALRRALDEEQAYSQQLTSIIQQLQNKDAPRQGTGRLIWPVRGPITSPFGTRMHPILHELRTHTGIDIGVASGTNIAAADSGTVIFAGWNDAYGRMTVIDHGGGISTMYAHQSAQLVKVGDQVRQGQTIGKVGTTGWSTGPHLHFEVRINGNPVSPTNYLK